MNVYKAQSLAGAIYVLAADLSDALKRAVFVTNQGNIANGIPPLPAHETDPLAGITEVSLIVSNVVMPAQSQSYASNYEGRTYQSGPPLGSLT